MSTGKPSTAADATIGTVYVGVSKAAAADVTHADVTVHYHNNVVIGDAGSTQKVTVKAETISIGENAGADTAIGHNDTTTPANSSGDVAIFGQNVVIAGNDESTAGSTKGVTIKGRNVKLGTENTTTNIEVGHISDAASGLTGSTVDVRGSVVSVSTDNELKFKSTKDGGNIAFETNVKDNGGGSFTGGVLTVSDPDYHKSCVLPEAIPNVKYVQKIIKDGQFGPGNRTLQITQAAAPASQYAFKIGDDLPANTKITRVSITVSTGFAWTSGGHGAAIVLANNRTDAQTGGTIIMPESDSDIEMLVSGGDTQTFMTEFGAGYDVSTTGVYVVFNSLFRPDNATAGDIRVLVEFVAMERGIANS